MDKKKILAFGEIIWDTYTDGATLGGAPLNFAAHCVKCGAESYLLSAVGQDELGKETRQAVQKRGVKTDFLQENEQPTGRCFVSLDKAGVPAYRIAENAAYDKIVVDEKILTAIRGEKFDAFYFGTLAQRQTTSRNALLKILENLSFEEIFCDINLRDGCYEEATVKTCFSYATTIKLSEEETPRLQSFAFWRALSGGNMEEKSKSLFLRFPRLKRILYTCGGDGAIVFDKEQGKMRVEAAACGAVVSTVGAGDSFGAVWLSAYMGGVSVQNAARLAAKVSGFVVSSVEAVPDYDIKRFL